MRRMCTKDVMSGCSPRFLLADKPKIKIPVAVVRTVPEHYVWCLAEGTPPINISLFSASTPLASGIGVVGSKISQEGKYTCMAENEAGSDSKDVLVALTGKNASGINPQTYKESHTPTVRRGRRGLMDTLVFLLCYNISKIFYL